MDRIKRFYRIDQLLRERRSVPVKLFLQSLDISLATFKGDLEYMRDRLNSPIEWNREQRGLPLCASRGRDAALPAARALGSTRPRCTRC